jgi:protein-S-isoprenylcysteine O-methyltransferase Ste14
MLLILAGIALWMNSVAVLAMLVPLFVIIRLGVVAREERYLERKFGADYTDYKRSVRRWL